MRVAPIARRARAASSDARGMRDWSTDAKQHDGQKRSRWLKPPETRLGRGNRKVAYGCLISRYRDSGWVSRAVRDLLAVQRSPACLYKLNEIGFACLKCGIGYSSGERHASQLQSIRIR